MRHSLKAIMAAALACALAALCLPLNAAAAGVFEIINPYGSVDWASVKPCRTQLHTHTTASDGKQTLAEAIENYYAHGYDFVAVTDHGVVDRSWVKPNHIPVFGIVDRPRVEPILNLFNRLFGSQKIQGLSRERLREITNGEGRGGRGMLRVPFGIEHNPNGKRVEINSWFSDWGNFMFWPGGNYEYAYPVKNIHRAGGLAMINHPSESGFNSGLSLEEIYAGEHYGYVNKIQVLLEKYPSLLGIELARNEKDIKLWDTLLTNLAPVGRNVFGITTSDSHGADTVDEGWVWTLMEAQTVDNLRKSLEAGAFFSAVKGDAAGAEPMVTEIAVRDGAITLAASNCDAIRWISDGRVIASGGEISLSEHTGELGAYVRAELRGGGGVLYTQPFLLSCEGMPEGRPVPCDYVDEGRRLVVWRTLLYPVLRTLDGIWKVVYFIPRGSR